MSNVELHKYIIKLKEEIIKSETKKPREGFWIGTKSLEMTLQTITEVNDKGGIMIYFLSAEKQKKKQTIQTLKIGFEIEDIETIELGDLLANLESSKPEKNGNKITKNKLHNNNTKTKMEKE